MCFKNEKINVCFPDLFIESILKRGYITQIEKIDLNDNLERQKLYRIFFEIRDYYFKFLDENDNKLINEYNNSPQIHIAISKEIIVRFFEQKHYKFLLHFCEYKNLYSNWRDLFRR
jgi:hypothetical protein